jgi:hypothetical protein
MTEIAEAKILVIITTAAIAVTMAKYAEATTSTMTTY